MVESSRTSLGLVMFFDCRRLTVCLARCYAAHKLSGWLGPDPLAGDITNPQSLNRYAYALNNPTTFTDPLGLDPAIPSSCSDFVYATSHAECPTTPLCEYFMVACGAPPGGGGGGGGIPFPFPGSVGSNDPWPGNSQNTRDIPGTPQIDPCPRDPVTGEPQCWKAPWPPRWIFVGVPVATSVIQAQRSQPPPADNENPRWRGHFHIMQDWGGYLTCVWNELITKPLADSDVTATTDRKHSWICTP